MPYADPERQKAAKAAWYRKEYATNPEFRAKQDAKRDKWAKTDRGAERVRAHGRAQVRRKNPHRAFFRFNMDTEAVQWLDLVNAAKAQDVKTVTRVNGNFVTVSLPKRHLAKIEGLVKNLALEP